MTRGRGGSGSEVSVNYLHPSVFLYPGGKFTPGAYFRPCERSFKKIHLSANLHPVHICSSSADGANI